MKMHEMPKSKVNIIEFLECFFGEELSNANVTAFKNMSQEYAKELLEFYYEYQNQHDNFSVSERKRGWERPFLWHHAHNGGLYAGGSSNETLLKSLLIYESVTITDPFRFNLSQIALGGRVQKISQFHELIDQILLLKPLIKHGIVSVVSDAKAYSLSRPYPDRTDLKFEDNGFVEYCETQGSDLAHSAIYPLCLGYLNATDGFQSDVLIGNNMEGDTIEALYKYWCITRLRRTAVVFNTSGHINLDLSGQSVEDIVNVRQNEQIFDDFRNAIGAAYETNNMEEFSKITEQAMRSFNIENKNFWSNKGKSILRIGLLGSAASTNLLGLTEISAELLVATGLATEGGSQALNLIDRKVANKLEVARGGAISLFSSIQAANMKA